MIRAPRLAAAVVLLTAAALVFRFASLGNRPFHGDEAVHAFKFRDLWEHGSYVYDPNEFHGPTIYYAALPTVALSGHHRFTDTQEADYRAAVALIGAAMIPILLLLRRFMGVSAAAWAALLTAISPAMVFYSRYYIQEIPLVCFTSAFIAFAWNYRSSRKVGWLAGAGIAAGLMIASKETAVLTFAAGGAAWMAAAARRGGDSESTTPIGTRIRPILIGAAIALASAYLLLSGLFTHPTGPLGYFHTFTPWIQRAGGTDLHNHPWTYYLSVLFWSHASNGPVWSEGFILILAIVGASVAFVQHSRPDEPGSDPDPVFMRFIAVFTLLLTLIYSAIPYKTPWCALNFLYGMILLAGYGAAWIMSRTRAFAARAVIGVALLGFTAQLAWQAYRASFIYFVDQRNPYVYAQPVPEVREVGVTAERLAAVAPESERMVIGVVWKDAYYWPIPWYLRRFPNVGYWNDVPPGAAPSLIIADPAFDERLSAKLDPTHIMIGFKGVRPGIPCELFVRMSLWERYLKRYPPASSR